MREKEARTKWCPYRREIVWFDSTGNQTPALSHNNGSLSCVASDCMMWRFKTNRQMGYDRNPDSPCLSAGYCGLGGKP